MNFPSHISISTKIVDRLSFRHYLKQVHGNRIVPIEDPKTLEGYFKNPVEADGSLTCTNLPLFVQTADCNAVMLFTDDPKGPIAAIHAGWRGVASGIVEMALSQFPKDQTHAYIAPSIGVCHFEVRDDLIEAFEKSGRDCREFLKKNEDQWTLDLKRMLIETQLQGLKHIHERDWQCTYCNDWPSYRREGKDAKRIVTTIQKQEKSLS